jgi:hypothetical protein
MNDQLVLAVLPGAHERERLVLMMSSTPGVALELVQQTWSDITGWYTQSSLEMTSEQVALLRAALGRSGAPSRNSASVPFGGRRGISTGKNPAISQGEFHPPVETGPDVLSLCEYRRAESA